MIFVTSYIHHLAPPSIYFNLSFQSLGWHPVLSALTSSWLYEQFPCTWYCCPQSYFPAVCCNQAPKFNSCVRGQTMHMWKNTTSLRFRVKSSSCHSANGYIHVNKLNRAGESMGQSLSDICDCTYCLIIIMLTDRVLTHASWHFPESWPDLT